VRSVGEVFFLHTPQTSECWITQHVFLLLSFFLSLSQVIEKVG
jgi:hypothetical protein